MAVEVGGRPVRCPARVRDTHVSRHKLLKLDRRALTQDLLLQQRDLARALDQYSALEIILLLGPFCHKA